MNVSRTITTGLIGLLTLAGAVPALAAENLKASCDRAVLAEAARRAAAVAGGAEQEAGRRVKIEAADGLTLTATDGVVSLRIEVAGARVLKGGETVVPASALASVVEAMRGPIVDIEAADPFLIVTVPGATSKIRTILPESFPSVPAFKDEGAFQVKAVDLARMIRQTTFAVVRYPAGRMPAGLLWEVADEKLSLAATDGKRLALAEGAGTPRSKDVKAVVPLRLMTLLAENLPKAGGTAKVRIDGAEIRLQSGSSTWSGVLVQSPFFDFRPLIPQPSTASIEVDRSDFAAALKAAAAIADKRDQVVRFVPAEGGLLIKAETAEGWTSSVFLEGKVKGVPAAVGFDAKYLLDWLEVMDEGPLTIEFGGPQRPLVCRRPGFLYLLMPVVW